MNSNSAIQWLPIDKLSSALQVEPALVVLFLAVSSFAIYKIFLRDLNQERHQNLSGLFARLAYNTVFAAVFYALFWFLISSERILSVSSRLVPYVGLVALVSFANLFVKTCRILLFEYLFLKSMKVGVPLLLVNLFTLLISFILLGFFVTEFLGVKLAPLLATSAILSVVLGLALQDTLGNLFAGISLQIDKTFAIGDWLEVFGPQRVVGQVFEISWRATILISTTEEQITIPNRIMAQSEISNYSVKGKPIIRSQILRLPFDGDYDRIRSLLKAAALESKAVRNYPEPLVIFTDTTESWVTAKLLYFITDYGSQFVIADKVLSQVLVKLRENGVNLAQNRLLVSTSLPISGQSSMNQDSIGHG